LCGSFFIIFLLVLEIEEATRNVADRASATDATLPRSDCPTTVGTIQLHEGRSFLGLKIRLLRLILPLDEFHLGHTLTNSGADSDNRPIRTLEGVLSHEDHPFYLPTTLTVLMPLPSFPRRFPP
jgi:hypothetical protein